jgi:hypothetical protein
LGFGVPIAYSSFVAAEGKQDISGIQLAELSRHAVLALPRFSVMQRAGRFYAVGNDEWPPHFAHMDGFSTTVSGTFPTW